MKLATLRIDGTTAAVRVDDENDTVNATVINGYPDLSALLATADWE
ncbi:MAG TPA: 2-hydroxyhepta-2,4-diene-1,7-dioate isomerase, partial [Mycobacterium sp.]|nr:2-hydroxyhepta-2,4-diene-1,7-dioate isomerase [Mycobacterium sp.]